MDRRQRAMVGHGAIVIFIALAAGFGLATNLVGGFEIFPGTILQITLPGDGAAWARAHTGGLLNGLLVFAGAVLIHVMRLPERPAFHLGWMFVGTGYANTIFYWGALFAPSRALTFGDNRFGETSVAGVIGLLPAFIFAFVTMAAMVILMVQAFGRAPDNR